MSIRTTQINHQAQASDESYFISLSDLLVGLLFIFIIILMAFAIAYRSAEDELTNTDELKETLLVDIQQSLRDRGVEVSIDIENGVLHLPESILFKSGSAFLNTEGRENVNILAYTLYELLPCYTISDINYSKNKCDMGSDARGRLDTVFIEGHTDDVPMGTRSTYKDNWDLSKARAIYIYKTLVEYKPDLDQMNNTKNQPVLSISAYEARRPRSSPESMDIVERRALNRRIDMRFLMVAPRKRDARAIEQVGDMTKELMNDQ